MAPITKILGAALALAFSASALSAEPAIIYDLGSKFDKSFLEAAYNGALRWQRDSGGNFREIELQSEAQREQAIRRFAETGANPVITVGFTFGNVLNKVAPDYPDTKFAIIDTVVDRPNVRSVVFLEHEGAYLAGLMAALASESGTVGIVGGMDIPLIRKVACGYVQGAKAANPNITVIQNMTGTTPAAWNDPVKGAELTKAQIAQGADVVFAAAGGTGIGVLQAAADQNILSIGADSNQNYLHPGQVLTSILKRVDNAVYEAMAAGAEVETGISVMGIANGGIGYALDAHNAALVSADMKARVDAAAAQIAAGALPVHDYTTDDSCPVN